MAGISLGFSARMAAGAVVAVGVILAAYFVYQSTLNAVAPGQPAPTITAPVVQTEPAKLADKIPAPRFDLVRVEPDGSSVIAGHATAGAPVAILLDGTEVGQATADAQGNFVAMLSLPANEGAQILSLSIPSSGGASEGAAVASKDSVIIAPVMAAEHKPEPIESKSTDLATDLVTTSPATTDSQTENVPAPPVLPVLQAPPAVLLANEQGVRVLQPASPNPALSNTVVIDVISYDAKGDVQLSGRGLGDGFVRVYLDDAPVQTTQIDAAGGWHTELPNVDTGLYTLRVDQVDAAGSVTSRIETPFKREPAGVLESAQNLAKTKQISVVTVQPGSTLWAIARDTYGDGALYVRVFAANSDNIRNPDLIYPGQVFTVPE